MNIFGNEYGFMLTVGASEEISELCPDGDLSRLGEVLQGSYSQTIGTVTKMLLAMSRAYDLNRAFEGHPQDHPELTANMLKALPQDKFLEAQGEAMAAFRNDTKTTVEVEPSKKKENPEGLT